MAECCSLHVSQGIEKGGGRFLTCFHSKFFISVVVVFLGSVTDICAISARW